MAADALHTADRPQSFSEQRTRFIISIFPEGQTERVNIYTGDFHHG
ncbi:hypothetical protein [Pseudomonas fluorescens]